MKSRLTPKVIAGAVAGLAVAGGGAAVAATQFGSPKENQAVLNDAAKQLGVQPSALSAALKKALENRVDAAVAAGRLTKAEGDELKQRIELGDVPVSGLVDALVAAAKKKLDAAVADGRLTRSQADSFLSDLKAHIAEFVNGVGPRFGHFRGGLPPRDPNGVRTFDGPGL